jgi:hypothetical protein
MCFSAPGRKPSRARSGRQQDLLQPHGVRGQSAEVLWDVNTTAIIDLLRNSPYDKRCVGARLSAALLRAGVGRVRAFLLNSNLVGSFANSREFLYDV